MCWDVAGVWSSVSLSEKKKHSLFLSAWDIQHIAVNTAWPCHSEQGQASYWQQYVNSADSIVGNANSIHNYI